MRPNVIGVGILHKNLGKNKHSWKMVCFNSRTIITVNPMHVFTHTHTHTHTRKCPCVRLTLICLTKFTKNKRRNTTKPKRTTGPSAELFYECSKVRSKTPSQIATPIWCSSNVDGQHMKQINRLLSDQVFGCFNVELNDIRAANFLDILL